MGPVRTLPTLNDYNRAYWTGGSDGRFYIQQCGHCEYYIFPPAPVCRRCKSLTEIEPVPVSGRAVVITYSVNHHPWAEGQERYVMALVQLVEQPDLRIVTNIVDCPIDQVSIGMEVEVTFEQAEDIWVPLFRPAAATA